MKFILSLKSTQLFILLRIKHNSNKTLKMRWREYYLAIHPAGSTRCLRLSINSLWNSRNYHLHDFIFLFYSDFLHVINFFDIFHFIF